MEIVIPRWTFLGFHQTIPLIDVELGGVSRKLCNSDAEPSGFTVSSSIDLLMQCRTLGALAIDIAKYTGDHVCPSVYAPRWADTQCGY